MSNYTVIMVLRLPDLNVCHFNFAETLNINFCVNNPHSLQERKCLAKNSIPQKQFHCTYRSIFSRYETWREAEGWQLLACCKIGHAIITGKTSCETAALSVLLWEACHNSAWKPVYS